MEMTKHHELKPRRNTYLSSEVRDTDIRLGRLEAGAVGCTSSYVLDAPGSSWGLPPMLLIRAHKLRPRDLSRGSVRKTVRTSRLYEMYVTRRPATGRHSRRIVSSPFFSLSRPP